MRRRPKAEESARERLLTAALSAFASYGFEGASTHGIAEAAEAPQGLIRHHFGSKEGLWSAVVAEAIARVLADLEAIPEGLTAAAWMTLVERHVELAGVLLQALLEGGARVAVARAQVGPVVDRLLAFQRRAQPQADAEQLLMWLAASLATPLLHRALGSASQPTSDGRNRTLDVLFAWLTASRVPPAAGPFALHTARSHLRGASY